MEGGKNDDEGAEVQQWIGRGFNMDDVCQRTNRQRRQQER